MQERRTLVYIKEEDIPASATVLDFSDANITGNVLYVPIYSANRSGSAYFPAYTYGSGTTYTEVVNFEAVDISTFPASVSVRVGDTGTATYLYCGTNFIMFAYPFVKSGNDKHNSSHVFDIRGSSYGIILMPIAQSFAWSNGASGWITSAERPIYPNGYIKLIFTNTKIRLKYTRDTFIQFNHPIYIDTE